ERVNHPAAVSDRAIQSLIFLAESFDIRPRLAGLRQAAILQLGVPVVIPRRLARRSDPLKPLDNGRLRDLMFRKRAPYQEPVGVFRQAYQHPRLEPPPPKVG